VTENRPGGEYITRYEAEKLMTIMLKEYERDIVEPRHKETQGSLAGIGELIQQGFGMLKLAGALGSIAATVWIVIQIKQAVAH
jgi:hypothetical protein